MDVVCGRCRAEYEFDDALISERGTIVRCTNCGLQFKVFPPVGQRAPEIWRVFQPDDRDAFPVEYPSLRELQKAIARGDVLAEHLLSRGGDEPRPLGEIVELQPLLQQPRSELPPPMPEDEQFQVPASPSPGVSLGSSTVLGVVQRPDPAAIEASQAAPAPPMVQAGIDPTSTDPATNEQAQPAGDPAPESRESKPRIRSALSMSPSNAPKRPSTPPPAGDESPPSLAPPRQSLRSTLVGSFSPDPIPPEEETSRESPPAPEPQPPADPDNSESSAESREEPPAQPSAPPPVEERPAAPAEGESAAAPAEGDSSAATAIRAPVDPEITDSGEFAAQMTPTPGAMRAYRTADSEPVSSMAGMPMKRGARSGGIVLAVLVGGAAFLGFANRDRIADLVSGSQTPVADSDTLEKEVSPDLASRVEMADAAWISDTLLETPESRFEGGPDSADLEKIQSDLIESGAEASWHMVNIERVKGNYSEARDLAGNLTKGTEQFYSLALLDLAEGGENPPWPVIVERLKEASTGERDRFLARSVYIYALAASGEVPRARADFESFGKIAGATDAPLYAELEEFLSRQETADESGEDSVEADLEEPSLEEEPAEDKPPTVAEQPAERDARSDPVPAEKEPASESEMEPPPAPKPIEVSAAIKAKVEQADAMWRGGNQDGALAIYRQVVAEIGTKHFLGQRSAARIRQAQRERAGSQ